MHKSVKCHAFSADIQYFDEILISFLSSMTWYFPYKIIYASSLEGNESIFTLTENGYFDKESY